ncbi:ATP-binding protein (plasmid) [Rhizobium ruizarguesonis]|uniref:ATP-binding protein n=1 Tax=Rhizobium ruizarguesonis TaxID=2081791 RepID=UPI00163992A3|nr:ATP-binding protein [Rhizobium ruizarguesonis]MBC2807672.1 ATP-binding protein [Rhizobium ruizarguesonis]
MGMNFSRQRTPVEGSQGKEMSESPKSRNTGRLPPLHRSMIAEARSDRSHARASVSADGASISIAVLVGRNGVGKTRLLKAMVDGLVRDEEQLEDHYDPRYSPVPPVGGVLVFSSVPTDPFPRSIAAWKGIDYEYFPINAVVDEDDDPLLVALVACVFEKRRFDLGEDLVARRTRC